MTNQKDIQPYEPLKANVDAALEEVHAQMLVLQQGINGGVGPLTSSMDAHAVNKAIAVLEASVQAFASEYQHMATLNKQMRDQRDEMKRKLESLKRLFNRIFNGDDDEDDNASTSTPKKGKK